MTLKSTLKKRPSLNMFFHSKQQLKPWVIVIQSLAVSFARWAHQITSLPSFQDKRTPPKSIIWSCPKVLPSPNPCRTTPLALFCNNKNQGKQTTEPAERLSKIRPASFDVRPIQPVQAVDLLYNEILLSLRCNKSPSNQFKFEDFEVGRLCQCLRLFHSL